jgi:hypothetical protein
VRIILAVIAVLLLVSPDVASSQTVFLHGAGGPTMLDRGSSVAAGVGLSPTPRLTVMVDVERTHISSRLRTDDRGVSSAFRGGTLTVAVAAMRVTLLGPDRVGPYVLAGVAAGLSRPNVNDLFPSRVTNEVRGPFFGGGIQVPLRDRVTLFADVRMMLMVGKDADELFAVAPIRAGIAWRF